MLTFELVHTPPCTIYVRPHREGRQCFAVALSLNKVQNCLDLARQMVEASILWSINFSLRFTFSNDSRFPQSDYEHDHSHDFFQEIIHHMLDRPLGETIKG